MNKLLPCCLSDQSSVVEVSVYLTVSSVEITLTLTWSSQQIGYGSCHQPSVALFAVHAPSVGGRKTNLIMRQFSPETIVTKHKQYQHGKCLFKSNVIDKFCCLNMIFFIFIFSINISLITVIKKNISQTCQIRPR